MKLWEITFMWQGEKYYKRVAAGTAEQALQDFLAGTTVQGKRATVEFSDIIAMHCLTETA